GEDDDSRIALRPDADLFQVGEQGSVFAGLLALLGTIAFDCTQAVCGISSQPIEVAAFTGDCVVRLMGLKNAQPVVDRLDESFRAGKEGFGKRPGEEVRLARIGAVSGGVEPDLVELLGDG